MNDRFLEQRIKIKFCAKLGKNASDTCAMLFKAYGREAMKKSSVFEWHKRFKERRENMEDDDKSNRSRCDKTDGNVEKVRNLVNSGKRFSIRAMAVQLNLDKGTVRQILSDDFGMKTIGFSTMTVVCQAFSGPKIDY
jgi:hypothetical protein